jgi:hypothetical protein
MGMISILSDNAIEDLAPFIPVLQSFYVYSGVLLLPATARGSVGRRQ